MTERYRIIGRWTEDELTSNIPSEETDFYEFKSSSISVNELKKKLPVAASAFWNSGGGIFVAGVDDNGKIDGGISNLVGRQTLRDWADQILSSVEPVGPYIIKTIEPKDRSSSINPDHKHGTFSHDECSHLFV